MSTIKSIDRCDSHLDGSDRRCPNKGEHLLVRTKTFSGEKQALWLCEHHYLHGGAKFSPTPKREIPPEGYRP